MRQKYNQDKKLSRYNEGDIKILKEILSDYSVDGEISLKKMEDGMDARTKKAIKILEDVYNGLGEMQFYATAIVRGDAIDLINSYVHHKVDNSKSEEDVQLQNATEYMNIQPGSKSKTSIARTPGAKAIDFDPISTALRGVRNTGLDYYLSNEISTTRQSLAENIKIADRNANEEVREVALDLKKVYNEALGNVISSNMSTNVAGGKLLDASRRIGYYAALASVPRAVAEFTSNLAFSALSNPGEAMLGMSKYKNLSFNETGRLVVQNTGATTNTKLYNDEQLGGSKADQQGIVRGKKSRRGTTTELGEVTNKIGRYLMIDKGLKGVEKVGEFLISTPDQMISRPLWFGTFAKTFKQETGNEVDFDKIADNDSDYMEKNREAIKNARNAADKNVTQAATSNSPFSGVLKNQISDTDSDKMNYYRTLNAYMARFSLNEYATARQAFASMIGKGQMGQIQGAGTLAGVLTRMSMYVLLYRGLSNAVLGALGFGEDEEDLESLATSTYRQAVGAATSILTRGMTGNIPMLPINMAIEKINEEYGFEFGLRDQEEYDPYKNSLIFSAINNESFERDPYKQIGIILAGPLTPQVKSAMRMLELSLRSANNKTKESREKNLKELISEQTVLEIFNMVGLVPFYRDIRAGMLKEKYKAKPEELKPLTLEEMKKLDPKGYEKLQQKKEDIKNSASYKRQERLFKEYNKKLKSMELQFD